MIDSCIQLQCVVIMSCELTQEFINTQIYTQICCEDTFGLLCLWKQILHNEMSLTHFTVRKINVKNPVSSHVQWLRGYRSQCVYITLSIKRYWSCFWGSTFTKYTNMYRVDNNIQVLICTLWEYLYKAQSVPFEKSTPVTAFSSESKMA